MESTITLKVLPESRTALKILAAQRNTTMIILFDELIQEAFKSAYQNMPQETK